VESDRDEVVVTVRPGAGAQVSVDGVLVGESTGTSLMAVGFNCGHHGYYLDDVELLYGN